MKIIIAIYNSYYNTIESNKYLHLQFYIHSSLFFSENTFQRLSYNKNYDEHIRIRDSFHQHIWLKFPPSYIL